jgi:hypothetical protein
MFAPGFWTTARQGLIFLLTKKGGHGMHFKKIFILIALSLAIGFFGCAERKVEAPTQERITKNLVPPKAEVKGENFLIELSDLQVTTIEDITSKEIVETPKLTGHIVITNKSKGMLDIQGVTVEYLDQAGEPIHFESGEKIATASLYLRITKPEQTTEGSLDVTIPRKAIKEKALGKIEISLVYIPSPLNRETIVFPEKIE